MSPYYEQDGISIYCGDAREVLPALASASVDLILTDPPYNVSERNGRDGTTVGQLKRKDGSARKIWKDFGAWDRGWDAAPFLSEARRLLRPGGSLIAFTSEFLIADYLASGLNHRALIYWRKTNPTPAFRQLYVRAVEMAVWQANGASGWVFNGDGYTLNHYEGPGVVGHATGDEPRVHPTQKPEWLMAKLLAVHSDPGALVVDPFMGSGTTLRAAKDLGRRAIGIEINEEHCATAVKRLQQAVLPLAV